MNAARRKEIDRAVELLEDAKTIIEAVGSEEQDAFDNMPESIQDSDRGNTMEEAAQAMEEAASQVDEVIQAIVEVQGG